MSHLPSHMIRDWSGTVIFEVHQDGTAKANSLQSTSAGITANAGGVKSSGPDQGVIVYDANNKPWRIIVSPTGLVSSLPVA